MRVGLFATPLGLGAYKSASLLSGQLLNGDSGIAGLQFSCNGRAEPGPLDVGRHCAALPARRAAYYG